MNIDFLSPIQDSVVEHNVSQLALSFGNKVSVYSSEGNFPNLTNCNIAILGVLEGRRASGNYGCGGSLEHVRRCLYDLFYGDWSVNVVDIGNIRSGNTVEDTYFAVSQIVSVLLKQNIIPVILGGSQDVTYANYRAYDALEQTVNLVSIDSRFDLGDVEQNMCSKSYLSKIIMESPNNLFNYCNIGYQTYFNSQEEIKLLDSLSFDTYRLGKAKDLEIVEPAMRDADIVSLDVGAIRQSEAPANNNSSPNGFNGEEICAIARYAGISDKVSSFGVYEYNPCHDIGNQTAHLIAQVVWYFIEGVSLRAKDYPQTTKENYQKFTVVLDDDDPINFFKSDRSGRWWMEINLITNNKYKRHTLIPCNYSDYKIALDGKMPERWYKTMQKLT